MVLSAAALAFIAAILFAGPTDRARVAAIGAAIFVVAAAGQASGLATFNVTDTKGHQGDRVLFSKWNSFSRVAVYARTHGDWSLSPSYHGPLPDTRFMDIDSAASTPILHASPDLSNVQYLRYELTALGCGVEFKTEFRFTLEGTGTRVEVTLGTRAVSLWAKLFKPIAYLMRGMLRKCLAHDLDQIRAAIEGGKKA